MWSAHNHYWPSEGGKGVWFDSESSMFNAVQFSKETGDKCIGLTNTIDWQQISPSPSSTSLSSPLSLSSSTSSPALSWCLSSLSVSLAFNCYGLYLIISWTRRQMHCHTVFLWTFHDLEIFHKKVWTWLKIVWCHFDRYPPIQDEFSYDIWWHQAFSFSCCYSTLPRKSPVSLQILNRWWAL